MKTLRTIFAAVRRIIFADPVKDYLAEWANEIEQETAARKRRNTDA
ncbi:hypothetical protein [Mesorhizobium sp. M1B.F.Ca.ET.045.04.1.1]|nr:hypothetical protein [Mesorhizobium sp. M1B.F.Ca.ET.045.04.1.1]